MWPGSTTDVTTLLPVVERIRKRFGVGNFCVVADRGMISAETLRRLEENKIGYILGYRMRKVKEIQTEVLTRVGRYRELYPEEES
jgi:transposase